MTKSTKINRLIIIFSAIALLLAAPLIAMQFTDEVQWTAADFVIMGLLLSGTAFACELVIRKFDKLWLKIALCAVALLVFLLIWAELAVGILGTPFAGS